MSVKKEKLEDETEMTIVPFNSLVTESEKFQKKKKEQMVATVKTFLENHKEKLDKYHRLVKKLDFDEIDIWLNTLSDIFTAEKYLFLFKIDITCCAGVNIDVLICGPSTFKKIERTFKKKVDQLIRNNIAKTLNERKNLSCAIQIDIDGLHLANCYKRIYDHLFGKLEYTFSVSKLHGYCTLWLVLKEKSSDSSKNNESDNFSDDSSDDSSKEEED